MTVMRVFVDESGDTGFKFEKQSSRYFAVAMVIFENEEKEAKASQRIDMLRQELQSPNIEFHFAKNKDATRKAFFTAAKDMDFTAFIFVADKTRLSQSDFKDRDTFYKSICGSAFERAKYLMRNADVLFDESGGEKFKKELGSYLRKRVNSDAKNIKNVGTEKSAGTSQSSSLIQLADMVCGAVYRSLQGGDDAEVYQKMIKHKLDAVIFWPDSSTPAPREI